MFKKTKNFIGFLNGYILKVLFLITALWASLLFQHSFGSGTVVLSGAAGGARGGKRGGDLLENRDVCV